MNSTPGYPNSVIAANIEKARQLRSHYIRELLSRAVRAARLQWFVRTIRGRPTTG